MDGQAALQSVSSVMRPDLDAEETQEWLDSLADVLHRCGPERVRYLLSTMQQKAYREGVTMPFSANTPYVNTIPADQQPRYPGSREIERRIKSIIRWNAMAMVVRANQANPGIGGHISTYASAATLVEVGYNHFFRGKSDDFSGDQIFFSGTRGPRNLFAGVSGRAADGRSFEEFSARASAGRRAVVVSASVVDAGLLGIPDGVDGTGAHSSDLSGAVQPIHGRPRVEEHGRGPRLVLHGRRGVR